MDTDKCIEICNGLLRDELSAMDAYDQAIKKLPEEAETAALKAIHHDHALSAESLRRHIENMGGSPSGDTDAWERFTAPLQDNAKVPAKEEVVGALLEGEKKGKQDYQQALSSEQMMREHKEDIESRLLPRQERHIGTLERLA